MTDLFKTLLAISVLVFPIASMFGVGLGYTLREIAGPFRHPNRIFRAVVANFVLVPLLALGIARALALEPAYAIGLMLVGTAAGAPFLIKLTQGARGDPALSASLLVLLLPLTVIYMPLVVPLVVPDVTVNALGIATPLILTLIVPLVVGLGVAAASPRWAARLRPIMNVTSTVALLALIISTIVVNARGLGDLFGTGAIFATFLLVVGAFLIGYLIAAPGESRRTVMGLGAGQRNIAAAMVVASQDFGDPDVLVMVVVASVVGLAVLFPIAWLLRRREGRVAPPTGHGAFAPSAV